MRWLGQWGMMVENCPVPRAVPSAHLCRSALPGVRHGHRSSVAGISLSPPWFRQCPEFPWMEPRRKGCNTKTGIRTREDIWGLYSVCSPGHFCSLGQTGSKQTTVNRRQTEHTGSQTAADSRGRRSSSQKILWDKMTSSPPCSASSYVQ